MIFRKFNFLKNCKGKQYRACTQENIFIFKTIDFLELFPLSTSILGRNLPQQLARKDPDRYRD